MKKKWIAAACLVLSLVLLCSCSLPSFFDPGFFLGDGSSQSEVEKEPRRTIPYADMVYQRPDVPAMKTQLQALTQQLEDAESFDRALELVEEFSAVVEEFSTLYTLAMLKKYHDVTDSYFEEEYRYLDDESVELSLLTNDFNRILIEGEYAETYRDEIGDYLFESIQNDLLLNSEAVQAYKKERNQLNADYNKNLSTFTVSHEGQEYTLDELDYLGGAVGTQLQNDYYQQYAPWFAATYARMVELDKLTAEALGFASAAEMYYLSYSRDYSPADAMTLSQNVKQIFVPLIPTVFSQYFDGGTLTLDEAFAAMPKALNNIDTELVNAWNFMTEYGLYDCAPEANKQAGIAFTTEINGYDAPFFYSYWSDDFYSATTIMHEFGHFYDNWLHYGESVVFNLDIAEVYSQGLELLLHEYYGEFTPYGEDAALDNLQGFIDTILFQTMLEEFSLQAYELDSFDETSIGQLFAQIGPEYGLNFPTDENGASHYWFRVTHLFDAPFYTISYVTSAVAALQIWAEAQEDQQRGVDTYLALIRADQNQPFTALLESAGLQAVHKASVLREIAGYFEEAFTPGRPRAA